MKNKPVPYLCGGILLVMLTEAKGKAATRRQLRSGKKDKVSNRNILEGLIKLMMPSFQQPLAGRTFDGDTTDYRACKVEFGENLPFDDDIEIEGFDKRVKTQYMSVLRKMDEFIDDFLRTDSDERMQWLIKALLTLIDNDHLITPETPFYLSETPVTKTDLLSNNHYCLSSLLLAIWHFIVTNRPDNKTGRETFESLHNCANVMNAKWVFKKGFGMNYPRDFDFDLFGTANIPETEIAPEEYVDETKNDPTEEAESEVVEVEVIDNPDQFETKKVVKEGRVYQQQAHKIYNIEHIENFYG